MEFAAGLFIYWLDRGVETALADREDHRFWYSDQSKSSEIVP
jgi:hypothetical protein